MSKNRVIERSAPIFATSNYKIFMAIGKEVSLLFKFVLFCFVTSLANINDSLLVLEDREIDDENLRKAFFKKEKSKKTKERTRTFLGCYCSECANLL